MARVSFDDMIMMLYIRHVLVRFL